MRFHVNPARHLKGLLLAGLLITFGASAMAQGAPPAGQGSDPRSEHMGKHGPAKMQARMAKHQADLKGKLKLTPAQEGAWTAYTTAMQPPTATGMRPSDAQRAELDKLTTPEHVDKMRAMRTERITQMNAAMDKRGDAAKAMYAVLTPEQQKIFDAEHKKHSPRGEHGEHHGQQHKNSN